MRSTDEEQIAQFEGEELGRVWEESGQLQQTSQDYRSKS